MKGFRSKATVSPGSLKRGARAPIIHLGTVFTNHLKVRTPLLLVEKFSYEVDNKYPEPPSTIDYQKPWFL